MGSIGGRGGGQAERNLSFAFMFSLKRQIFAAAPAGQTARPQTNIGENVVGGILLIDAVLFAF